MHRRQLTACPFHTQKTLLYFNPVKQYFLGNVMGVSSIFVSEGETAQLAKVLVSYLVQLWMNARSQSLTEENPPLLDKRGEDHQSFSKNCKALVIPTQYYSCLF